MRNTKLHVFFKYLHTYTSQLSSLQIMSHNITRVSHLSLTYVPQADALMLSIRCYPAGKYYSGRDISRTPGGTPIITFFSDQQSQQRLLSAAPPLHPIRPSSYTLSIRTINRPLLGQEIHQASNDRQHAATDSPLHLQTI